MDEVIIMSVKTNVIVCYRIFCYLDFNCERKEYLKDDSQR